MYDIHSFLHVFFFFFLVMANMLPDELLLEYLKELFL